ncbi:hypothetical protein ACXET9_10945 [Brachybacterium sp. DNPG3]
MSIAVDAAARAIGSRVLFVDWVRTAAYLLMVTAHVAPSDGPLRILLVSEFLTAPLFALLVGAGAQLGRERSAPSTVTAADGRDIARTVVRALLVLGLGLLLAQSHAAVVIVLMHLAVLMVLCIPLVRLGTRALAVAGVLAAALAAGVPVIYGRMAAASFPGPSGATADPLQDAVREALGDLGGAGPYRLTGFVLCAILGMLAVRLLRPTLPWARGAVATAAALAVFIGLVMAPNLLGLFEVHAYDGTPAEQMGVAAGALGVLLAAWTVQASPLDRLLPTAAAAVLAWPGQASLSLYALHVLILHVFQTLHPYERDDSWAMLALLIAVGLLAPVLWRAAAALVVRRAGVGSASIGPTGVGRAWVRGPLEGIIHAVQAGLVDARSTVRP